MPRSTDEAALTERFAGDYRLGKAEIMRELERLVFGCDYGGTSWTTRSEAQDVARLLALTPGLRLLEVGAGSGWPGLYLAQTTGCDVALVDLPPEGLRIAAERARADRLTGACWIAVADAQALPFRNGWFDAVSHSDVLCCLVAKLAVLKACRQAVRTGGKMVFTVISTAPDLSPADRERALDIGPPYVDAPLGYPELLRRAGWEVTHHADLTGAYAKSARRLIRAEMARAHALGELLGKAEAGERLAVHRRCLGVIADGLLRRDLFCAQTAPIDESSQANDWSGSAAAGKGDGRARLRAGFA